MAFVKYILSFLLIMAIGFMEYSDLTDDVNVSLTHRQVVKKMQQSKNLFHLRNCNVNASDDDDEMSINKISSFAFCVLDVFDVSFSSLELLFSNSVYTSQELIFYLNKQITHQLIRIYRI